MLKTQDDYVFSLYKPFRNQLRQVELLDSLRVMWAFSRNFSFNFPFPSDVELPANFLPWEHINERRYYGIPEFEQEFLVKEIIINCDLVRTDKSLRKTDVLKKVVNYTRFKLSEEIDKKFMPDDFLIQFNRMAHRQFNWQLGYNERAILRYYKIFSDIEVDKLVRNKLNFSTHQIFTLGFFFFRWVGEHFRTALPFTSEHPFFSNEMIAEYLNHFSITIEKAKQELKEAQEMNENLFYSYNPLLAKPILVHQNTFLCPIPLLFFWQITGGIYYSIFKESGFDHAFGNSYENYIGEIISRTFDTRKYNILKEQVYGREHKKTVDWLIIDNTATLFIECKAKRMTMKSKVELDMDVGLENDLKKMAGFITQVYKTYLDYKDNKYPHISYDSSKHFIPLVVTLEDWYLNFNLSLKKILNNLVVERFEQEGLDKGLLEAFPYHIRSSEEFEKDIQLINSLGIKDYFEKALKNNLHEIAQKFEYKNPFKGEFLRTFLDPLKSAL